MLSNLKRLVGSMRRGRSEALCRSEHARSHFVCGVFALAVTLAAVLVLAPGLSVADPATGGSLTELKAAAYDAQQKAHAAAAEAAQAKERLAEAEVAAESGPVTQQQVNELREEIDAARADAKEAREEASRATAEAEATRRELAEHDRKEKLKYARPGLFIGALGFQANESFDVASGIDIDNTQGGAAIIGYRIHERISFSLQYDQLKSWDVTGPGYEGDLDMWSATVNMKVYLLTRIFQPYLGVGLGAVRAKLKVKDDQGAKSDDRETAGLLKLSGGVDFYLTETLAITGDASVHLPSGDLSDLTYTTLGAGVKLRF